MKYLKLITEPSLPDDKHITFAYFGKITVSKNVLMNHLSTISPFMINVSRNDNFGPNNDIPCVVFDFVDNNIVDIRKKLLQELGSDISEQNRLEWTPHISGLQMENLEHKSYKIIGIKSNDGLFGTMF
jgi:2'-5' RNA ligase